MDYIISDKNTLVWFSFTVYAITAIFIVPNAIKPNAKTLADDTFAQKELQFGLRLVLRIALLFPTIALLKYVL